MDEPSVELNLVLQIVPVSVEPGRRKDEIHNPIREVSNLIALREGTFLFLSLHKFNGLDEVDRIEAS